jgi:hypothetical protein
LVADLSDRPNTLHCTLTPAQEAVAMKVRRTVWLPLDDLLVVVREFLNPKVSRSGLARCLSRHHLNRRPVEDKEAPVPVKSFKDYAPGFLHVDIKYLPQMKDETARRYLFVAIDRATRLIIGSWVHSAFVKQGSSGLNDHNPDNGTRSAGAPLPKPPGTALCCHDGQE